MALWGLQPSRPRAAATTTEPDEACSHAGDAGRREAARARSAAPHSDANGRLEGSPRSAERRRRVPRLPAAGNRSFVLQAISRKDGRPVAILNDRLGREGDSFDGVKILRIGEADVEIEVGGDRQVVRF